MKQNKISRRDFLRLAAASAGAAAISSAYPSYAADNTTKTGASRVPKINPAFRMRKISSDEVELFTHTGDLQLISHIFSDLEADLLKLIDGKRSVEALVHRLSKAHHLTVYECRHKVLEHLREWEEPKLIYYDGYMVVKISRIENGK